MANVPDPIPWDQAIKRLSEKNLGQKDVAELVGIVSKSLGDKRFRVFPKGIPWYDGIVVHAVIDPASLGSIFELLRASARIDTVRVFPRGIVNPEVFITEIELS